MKYLKISLVALASSLALTSGASAHGVALGWDVLPGGSVNFYLAHWHGNIASPAEYLTIDGINYNFTGIQNDLNSRSGLEGALYNPTYYSLNTGTGTLTANAPWNYNDWLTVTVNGLQSGTHTFSSSMAALTFWEIPGASGQVNFVLPPAASTPEGGSTLMLLGGLLAGLPMMQKLRRRVRA